MIDDDNLTHGGKHRARIPATVPCSCSIFSKAEGEGCAISKGVHAVNQYLKPRFVQKGSTNIICIQQ